MSKTTEGSVKHGVWQIDRSRSALGFRVRHFGVATVRGRFGSFTGELEARSGTMRIAGHIDAASVDTGNDIRDARLRSEFFQVQRYPTISLRASGAEGGRRLRGELTIRGATRPAALVLTVAAGDDGALRVRADGHIRRSDFGLDWNALREAGRLLVADEVRLQADIVLTRSQATAGW